MTVRTLVGQKASSYWQCTPFMRFTIPKCTSWLVISRKVQSKVQFRSVPKHSPFIFRRVIICPGSRVHSFFEGKPLTGWPKTIRQFTTGCPLRGTHQVGVVSEPLSNLCSNSSPKVTTPTPMSDLFITIVVDSRKASLSHFVSVSWWNVLVTGIIDKVYVIRPNLSCLIVGLFAELGSWIANFSSPIEVNDDVTSIGDETFAIQMPSPANRPTINQRTRATYIPHYLVVFLDAKTTGRKNDGNVISRQRVQRKQAPSARSYQYIEVDAGKVPAVEGFLFNLPNDKMKISCPTLPVRGVTFDLEQ
ncbi:hypothetical protein CLF_105997 [Clonorchis sinensis]|uniref:Uncharacterized protein n=1 Tax=Clonorchis sinensis TaxID=79923 RepID=G7YEI4_CLOSI|nr:hypothetical protein CLF_105997 [Clonorchis sinensis]